MQDILKEIQSFRTRLREVYQTDTTHVFNFEITMTERINLLKQLENKIEQLSKTSHWQTETKSRIAIKQSYQVVCQRMDEPNELLFFPIVTKLSNEIKSLFNRINQKETLLFATGIPALSKKLKNAIHDYDFLDEEIFYFDALYETIKEKQPSVVILTASLEQNATNVFALCNCHVHTRFILIGDVFLENEALQTLQRVKLLGSVVKNLEQALQ